MKDRDGESKEEGGGNRMRKGGRDGGKRDEGLYRSITQISVIGITVAEAMVSHQSISIQFLRMTTHNSTRCYNI